MVINKVEAILKFIPTFVQEIKTIALGDLFDYTKKGCVARL